jgi:hypothetical protein
MRIQNRNREIVRGHEPTLRIHYDSLSPRRHAGEVDRQTGLAKGIRRVRPITQTVLCGGNLVDRRIRLARSGRVDYTPAPVMEAGTLLWKKEVDPCGP